ncbi:MAG: substrate-binding domain-containing protein [Roseicyclus sp.]|nr:substrate-binding domain-containing protein [Roseicyclus sp.]
MITRALLACAFALSTLPAMAETVRMAVTTSFENSGLADVLLPEIQAELGIEVELLVVGTGQALRLGEAGDVDAVLVHSRPAEIAFVEAGHATHWREIMYNDFVLIGPSADPARMASAQTAADALARIAEAEALFVSRGDNSGTHQKELALWTSAGVDPEDLGRAYNAVGAGMGAALNTASGLNAYILSDRATWLTFGNQADLALLFSGDPEMFNPYSLLPVNPDRHPHVNNAAVMQLEDWLVGPRGEELINAYTVEGQTLFVHSAVPQ